MLNYKLNQIRTIVKEVERLEKMYKQISKSRDDKKRNEFYENLKLCRQEKIRLTTERLLDELLLSEGEKEMACNCYCKGNNWTNAYVNSSLNNENKDYEKDIEDDKYSYSNAVENHRKEIMRAVQQYYLFGNVQHQGTLNKALRRIIRDCNDGQLEKWKDNMVLLPNFSCHSLRHTFTTRLAEAGVNIKVVQELCGHSRSNVTLDVYTTVTKELKQREFGDFEEKMRK